MHDVSPRAVCKTWTSVGSSETSTVSSGVRALRYGDGVFVTLGIRAGRVLDARRQLERLEGAARRIGLEPPALFADAELAPRVVATLLSDLGADPGADATARLQWHAGPGRRGFGREDGRAEAVLDLGPAPEPRRPSVVLLGPGDAPVPALPRWKTCSALAHVLCERAAFARGADTGIRTRDGVVLEAAAANVFWLHGDRLFTPSDELPLYPGSVREHVIDAARDAGLSVEEDVFETNDLEGADAVILTNAARGLEFAASIDGRELPEPPAIAIALADAVAARREAAGLPLTAVAGDVDAAS